MGGGKKLCLGGTLSPFGSRLRTTRRYSWSFPFPRLRMPDDRPALQATGLKLITGSSLRPAHICAGNGDSFMFKCTARKLAFALLLVLLAGPVDRAFASGTGSTSTS